MMSWVPRKLAPQVRCILSMVNDTVHHQTIRDRESKPQELHLIPLDVMSRKVNVMCAVVYIDFYLNCLMKLSQMLMLVLTNLEL